MPPSEARRIFRWALSLVTIQSEEANPLRALVHLTAERAGDKEGMPAEREERSVEHPQEPAEGAEEALGAKRAEDGRQP